MRIKAILLLLLIASNLVIAQENNSPSGLFDWLEFLAALISFIVGWFMKQPQQIFKKKD